MPEPLSWTPYEAVGSWVTTERHEPALRELDRALARARRRGAVVDVGGVLALRSRLYLRIGELARADADARALLEVAAAYGWAIGEELAVACLGEVLIERGELADAARLLTDGPCANSAVLVARGRLRLAQGQVDAAIEDLRACGRRDATGLPWRSWLAHALVETGRVAEARRWAAEELEQARWVGAHAAVGVALVAAARAATGEDEVGLLREAVAVLNASAARLERARAHAALGAVLRRVGSPAEARDSLRVAVDLAHRCGATALEERALAELRASGARPRRRLITGAGALTRSERRIADLAAAGRQNREIAETLVVTLATVEYHLRHAYRKLGIASRTQLTTVLDAR